MGRTTTVTSSRTDGDVVFIANHHTAPILLPRTAAIGVMNVDPIVLEAGMITPINAEEWEARKAIKTVQYYLDHRILEETNMTAPAATSVTDSTTSDPQIPANLQTAEEQSKDSVAPGAAPVTATVRRQSVTQGSVQ